MGVMCDKKKCAKKAKKSDSLDTLAQLGTKSENEGDLFDSLALVSVDENKAVLTKRAKRKYLKVSLTLSLVDVNNQNRKELLECAKTPTEITEADNKDKDILRSYWAMYHCSDNLVRKNGKVTGRYCKNRLCLICNSIRTAVLLQTYKPVFDEWEADSYFVTLTAPTVCADDLNNRIDEMDSIVFLIKETLKKRYQRGNAEKFQGVRKLECTYNAYDDKYHPHFHFIIKGKENAEFLYSEWLERTKHLGTSKNAQDCQKARTGAAMELFKYFTKIINSTKKDRKIYAFAVDVIFKAFRKRRTIQNFGFKLPKTAVTKDFDEVLEDNNVLKIRKMQGVLSERVNDGYISVNELLELLDDKVCFHDVLEWINYEKSKGLPFIEIALVLEVLEGVLSDLSEYEEHYKWSQNGSDWYSEKTGEGLTGFEVDERTKELTNQIVKNKKKT